MTGSAKQKRIDELTVKLRESLQRSSWFEAERLALKALTMARQEQDFQRMAEVVPSLQEARRMRFQEALQTGKVIVFDKPITDDIKIERGCYLVQPPHVGADARRLRLAALTND